MNRHLALIVEDDVELATIFADILQTADMAAQVISDGQKALDWLAKNVPDIVLLDMHLPHVSGRDILAAIRGDIRLTKTQVVIITADATLASALGNRADLVLLKPVSLDQVMNLASRFLNNDNSITQ